MKNMQLTASEAKEYEGNFVETDAPKYPWGLEIRLNENSLKKLDMAELPAVGKVCVVSAKAVVTSASQRQEADGDTNRSVELQITDLELIPADDSDYESKASAMFPGMK